ncbi:MAG TPA: hypothetical protein VNI77_05840 [Nitrososphaera sp.]|nr:hypothetical protein [Nitrososphaera sp.]
MTLLPTLVKRVFSLLFGTRQPENANDRFHTGYYSYYYDNGRSAAALPRLEWISMLDRTVRLRDGSGVGKIEALNTENVVVKNGAINPIRYCFGHPMLKKDQNSGHYVVDLASNELTLYQRDMVPNPSYYVTLGGWHFGYMPMQNNSSTDGKGEGKESKKQR